MKKRTLTEHQTNALNSLITEQKKVDNALSQALILIVGCPVSKIELNGNELSFQEVEDNSKNIEETE